MSAENPTEFELLEEIGKDKSMQSISLESDIYTMGYCLFLRAKNLNRLDNIVKKCVFTFIVQVALFSLLILGWGSDGGSKSHSLLDNISTGDPYVNLSRVICGLLLHVTLLTEI